MPDKATKHIARHQVPVGDVRGNKIKIEDGDTGKKSWRVGTSGMARDFDGDPIAHNFNRSGMKPYRANQAKQSGKHGGGYKPKMGSGK